MEGLFLNLTWMLILAAGFGLVMHYLKQPPLLGYILTGVLIGSLGLIDAHQQTIFRSLSDVGVALLLFMVGLEMNLKNIKSVGLTALITGIGQIAFTFVIGVVLAQLLGFSLLTSSYLGLALAFSSTIIIVKLLSQKQDLDSLYGKIAVGFLLVQDFVAILALILLSGFTVGSGAAPGIFDVVFILGKAALLVGTIIVLSKIILPYLVKRLARSQELLFISSIAWAFAVAAFTASELIGFSVEIGGLLAGLALANTTEHLQISSRARPLRDFFIVIFFVLLGMQLDFSFIRDIWPQALALSAFVLIGNPLIVLILMALLGYRRRTSFLAGLTVAQISEFSLILIALGFRLGHLSPEILTLVTLIAVITMSTSAYLILEGDRVYNWLRPILAPFQRTATVEQHLELPPSLSDHIVIVGAHRTAENILKALDRKQENLVVVDFDPDVVQRLGEARVPVIFGDISDPDVADQAALEKAKMIISTVSDAADTKRLLERLRKRPKKTHLLVTAQDVAEAKEFYDLGADYVLLPHFVSGDHVAGIIADREFERRLGSLKKKHLKALANHTSS